MAKLIDHDFSSEVATVGTEAVKWGLGALVLTAAIGGGIGLGAAALIAGSTASVGFLTVAGLAGAAAGFYAGTVPTLVAAAFGVLKGGSKVHREKSAYAEQVQARQNVVGQKISDAKIQGGAEMYPVAFQDGQQSVVNAIQQQMMQAQAMEAQAAQPKFAANVKKPCESHAQAVTEQQAMPTGNQIG